MSPFVGLTIAGRWGELGVGGGGGGGAAGGGGGLWRDEPEADQEIVPYLNFFIQRQLLIVRCRF